MEINGNHVHIQKAYGFGREKDSGVNKLCKRMLRNVM